ncbi:MAG: alkaline phosphatase [Prolixibacteraceae bacterium]|nr:alkaline phosphatase [Prolixibacteraceae bacterium]
MKINSFLIISFLLIITLHSSAQKEYIKISVDDPDYYQNNNLHKVKYFEEPNTNTKPKNVILLIGDGMGTSQVYAAMVANGGELFFNNFKNIGFSKTYSADNLITDSAAGGTALATGEKTYNGAIGLNKDTVSIPNIREKAEAKGMATGVVSTSVITHATPASFVAHQPDRDMYEEIAGDFLKTNIDVFIGGGSINFNKRKDKKDLTAILKDKGYQVVYGIEEISKISNGKLAGFTSEDHNPGKLKGRGEELPIATTTAINILDNDPDGFFLMVEGSQIDWGGHANHTGYVISEVLDLDLAIGAALEFASQNKETLVIVTADHETGGFSVENGNIQNHSITGDFTTVNHTGSMVPVYSFGPGSENFKGVMQNTDIPKKISELLDLK